MQTLQLDTATYFFPASYAEVTREQLLGIAEKLNQKNEMTKIISQLLDILIPFEEILKKHQKALNWKAIDFKVDGKAYLKYLLKDKINFVSKVDIDKNILQYLDIQGVKYYQPLEMLANISFGQWSYAHAELFAYNITNDDIHLNRLIAILYLKNPKEFIEDEVDVNAKKFECINPMLKQFCLSYVANNWRLVYQRFKTVFEKSDSQANEASETQEPDWNPVIFHVAKSGVFGTVEQVFKTNFLSILLFLQSDKPTETKNDDDEE